MVVCVTPPVLIYNILLQQSNKVELPSMFVSLSTAPNMSRCSHINAHVAQQPGVNLTYDQALKEMWQIALFPALGFCHWFLEQHRVWFLFTIWTKKQASEKWAVKLKFSFPVKKEYSQAHLP